MRPRVIINNLMSIDGRLNVSEPDVGLYYEQAASLGADAMLCGSETMLVAFGTELPIEAIANVLPPDARRPLLVVVDGRGRVKCWDRILAAPHWRSAICLCCKSTPPTHLKYLRDNKIPCIVTGEAQVDLSAALEKLSSEFQVKLIRVDSGGILNGALLRAGLVDEIALMIAPSAIGSNSPASLFVLPEGGQGDRPVALQLKGVEQLRNGHVWIRYDVKKGEQ